MEAINLALLLWCCSLFVFVNSTSFDDDCTTPSGEPGSCMSVYDCEQIGNLLEGEPQPLHPKVIEFLRKFQCGFTRKAAKVCCPANEITRARMVTLEPQLADLSTHKNARLLPKNCGFVNTEARIYGGTRAGLFEFPWMAVLFKGTVGGAKKFICAGTIINKNYILTAGHCLIDSLVSVRVGDYNIFTDLDCIYEDEEKICAPPHQDLKIEEKIPYPDYSHPIYGSDIALIRVSTINLTVENVKPVCLPFARFRNYNFTNARAVVAGWGKTELAPLSPELLRIEVPVIPHETCEYEYRRRLPVEIKFSQLCAGGDKGIDSCKGDSGGPLLVVGIHKRRVRYYQQGVVSYGAKYCGTKGLPAIYTKVPNYMEWILNNLRP